MTAAVRVEGRPLARRGTSSKDVQGSAADRRRRREWLVETFRADRDLIAVTRTWELDAHRFEVEDSPFRLASDSVAAYESEELDDDPEIGAFVGTAAEVVPACRCYRCGKLLSVETLTVDRITPGCEGGTYRRNNIRPACGPCNSSTGGRLARRSK